jgi:hypothetical protein
MAVANATQATPSPSQIQSPAPSPTPNDVENGHPRQAAFTPAAGADGRTGAVRSESFKLISVDVPPGPIGVKLSKTKPITVLEVLKLPDGTPSPLTGHAQEGDVLYCFDGEICADVSLQVSLFSLYICINVIS